jgi:hypothetical protein
MLIEEALLARLQRMGAATPAIIGQDNIWPDMVPDDAVMPAMHYERGATKAYYLTDGTIDFYRSKFKFHCHAAHTEKVQALLTAAAVIQDLDGYRAALTGLTVHYCYVQDQRDDYDGITKRPKVIVEIETMYH